MATVEDILWVARADTEGLRRDLRRGEQATSSFARAANDNFRSVEGTAKRLNQALNQGFSNFGSNLSSRLGSVGVALQALGPAGLAASASIGTLGFALSSAVTSGDQIKLLQGRLEALTGSTDRAKSSIAEMFELSSQTGTGLDEIAQLFTRFTLAGESIGATQEQLSQLVETILKLGAIGGASQTELSNGAIQLAQALASGRLQGDELRSVLESLPLVAKAIADGLGVDISQLRQMGSEGELTSDKVFGALLKGLDETRSKFEALPDTVARSAGQLAAAWSQFTAELDHSLDVSGRLARILGVVTKAVQEITPDNSIESRIAGKQSEIRRKEASIGNKNNAFLFEHDIEKGKADLVRLNAELRSLVMEQYRRPVEPAPLRIASPTTATSVASGTRSIGSGQEATHALERAVRDQGRYQAVLDELKQEVMRLENERSAFINSAVNRLGTGASAEQVKTVREQAAALFDQREAYNALQKAQAEGEQLTQRLMSTGEAYAMSLKQINDLLAQGVISEKIAAAARLEAEAAFSKAKDAETLKAGQATAGIKIALKDYSDSAVSAAQVAKDATERALGGIQDAFVTMATTGKLSFKNMADSILADIARIAVRKAITGPLMSSFGGMMKNFFPLAQGGVFSAHGPVPLRRYASGGIARTPQMAMFGEGSRPEAYVPLPDGRSIPVSMKGGSDVTVNVKVFNQASGTAATVQQSRNPAGGVDLSVFVRELEGAIADRVATGRGPLSGALEGRYGLDRAQGAYR